MIDSPEPRRLRRERLRLQYRVGLDLLINETRLVLERGNIFLLANSILFTGFVVLMAQDDSSLPLSLLAIGLSVVGLSLSVAQPYLIARTIEASNFWRATIKLIEKDPDFWHPSKLPADDDLDVMLAKQRYDDGVSVRQGESGSLRRRRPPVLWRLGEPLKNPVMFPLYWLPVLIWLLWLFGLVVAIVQLFAGNPEPRPGIELNFHM